MSIEPTQADMAYAKSIVEAVEHGCTYEDRCLAVRDLLARHRLASTPASGEVVAQWRRIGTAPWWDGLPDHTDGGGPYEERTLYAAPSQPAADLVEALEIMATAFAGYADTDAKREAVASARAALSRYAGGA